MRNVPVFYNRGRWVARCPLDDCHAAEQLELDQTVFECNCTDPGACGHSPHRCGEEGFASWPEHPEEIEAICAPRPLENQNWTPGEFLEDLRRENIDHGLEVS